MTLISFTSKLLCLGSRKLREETRSMMDTFPHRSKLSRHIRTLTNVDITSRSFINSFHHNHFSLCNLLPNTKRLDPEIYNLWDIYYRSCIEIINLSHHIDYHRTCLLHKQDPYYFHSRIKPKSDLQTNLNKLQSRNKWFSTKLSRSK